MLVSSMQKLLWMGNVLQLVCHHVRPTFLPTLPIWLKKVVTAVLCNGLGMIWRTGSFCCYEVRYGRRVRGTPRLPTPSIAQPKAVSQVFNSGTVPLAKGKTRH
jgi:hypothetical protein